MMQNAIQQDNTSIKATKALLICGLIAGPLYIVVGLVQAFTRPGFNIIRHDLSLLDSDHQPCTERPAGRSIRGWSAEGYA